MDDFERIPVYRVESDIQPEASFKEDSGNGEFRRSSLTWLTMFVLLVLYPAVSVLFAEDPATLFGDMSNQMLLVMLVSTIIIQWCLFLLIYLTCLREQTGLIGKFKSWTVPVIISSVAFGACHYSYQGLPGLILITVYGLLLALLFVRTGRLWPCIVAHFFQDFLAMFVPQ